MLRSYNSKREVHDYKQLSAADIAILLASYKRILGPEAYTAFAAKVEGKDGRGVTDLEQLMHPGPDVAPLKKVERRTDNTRAVSPSGGV